MREAREGTEEVEGREAREGAEEVKGNETMRRPSATWCSGSLSSCSCCTLRCLSPDRHTLLGKRKGEKGRDEELEETMRWEDGAARVHMCVCA